MYKTLLSKSKFQCLFKIQSLKCFIYIIILKIEIMISD